MICWLFICLTSLAPTVPAQPLTPPVVKPGEKISWAIADTSGRIRGENIHRTHKSASLTKAMLAVVYARQHPQKDLALAPTIKQMITVSDNTAADRVLAAMDSHALDDFARKVGMKNFRANGYWANADVSAYDQALFWRQLPQLIPIRHRPLLMSYFANIAGYQQWGMPTAMKQKAWRIYQKAGWRPEGGSYRFNQAVRACHPGVGCWAIVYLSENMSSASATHWRAQEFARKNTPDAKSCQKVVDNVRVEKRKLILTTATACKQ